MDRILLVDGHDHLHRAFYAYPSVLVNSEGVPINAVYGFLSMFLSAIHSLKPRYVLVAFDLSRKDLRRTKEFPEYKATRIEMEPEVRDSFVRQEGVLFDFLRDVGARVVTMEGYEADDIIGSFAVSVSRNNGPHSAIYSNDRDMFQLINDKITVYVRNPKKNGETRCWEGSDVVEEYGFEPSFIVDYKALRGDPSDNIPGVKGVGDKTARELVRKFNTIENLYNNISKVENESLRKKLLDGKDSAILSKKLATIVTDLEIDVNLQSCEWSISDNQKLKNSLEKFNFKSLLKQYFGKEQINRVESNRQMGLI